MEKYKLLYELNRKEQFGEEITEEEKAAAVSILLNGKNNPQEILQYKKRMRVDPKEDKIYPCYYLPPYYNGKKLRLVQGYLPKTNILYANHYEAEILRLLVKFAPENEEIKDMVSHTLARFDKTCFGNSCENGECFTAGICVLRLLAEIHPGNEEWIHRLLEPLGKSFLLFGPGQAAVQRGIPLSYLLMVFAEINDETTRFLIAKKKEWLIQLLRTEWITGKLSNGKISEMDTYNLLMKYIIRNAVCTLPEYSEKEKYKICINDTNGRCFCDIPY